MIPQFAFAIRSNPTVTKRLLHHPNRYLPLTTHPFTSSTKTNDAKPNPPPTLPFRPRRRAPKPLLTPPPPKDTYFHNSKRHPTQPASLFDEEGSTGMDTNEPGPAALRYLRRAQQRLPTTAAATTTPRLTSATISPPTETILRAADYFSSEPGSTEDLIGERRAINLDAWSPEEGRRILRDLDAAVAEEKRHTWMDDPQGMDRWSDNGGETIYPEVEEAAARERERWNQRGGADDEDDYVEMDDDDFDPNQRAFGQWSESVVAVDRVQKVMRGGTTVRYRALAIGGNLNGCAGYGVAKAHAPPEAVAAACRMTRRNIFFVDRYQNSGLTTDLVGKHNSCRVLIRAVGANKGLKGNALGCEIMKYFGITDCTIKTHGNRNDYNVVYATFKALLTHESMEDIALKRGKRLLNLERAKRLKI